jgi:hypothetical protein
MKPRVQISPELNEPLLDIVLVRWLFPKPWNVQLLNCYFINDHSQMLLAERGSAEVLDVVQNHSNLLILLLRKLVLVLWRKRGNSCEIVLRVSVQNDVEPFACDLLNFLFYSFFVLVVPLCVLLEFFQYLHVTFNN